jgi:hypothetical protein
VKTDPWPTATSLRSTPGAVIEQAQPGHISRAFLLIGGRVPDLLWQYRHRDHRHDNVRRRSPAAPDPRNPRRPALQHRITSPNAS